MNHEPLEPPVASESHVANDIRHPMDSGAPPFEPASGRLNLPLRVRALERAYLVGRRQAAGVALDQPRIGLAFSGGGIRSATFCLGVTQALSKAGVLQHVDYLSTVSGGGYFGSCLSSYLSHPAGERSSHAVPTSKPKEQPELAPADRAPALAPDLWSCETRGKWTLERARFPFHQEAPLQHLRTHGDFLVLRDMLLSRDVLRVVGILFTGVLATLGLFLLAMLAIASLSLALVQVLGGPVLWWWLSERRYGTWSQFISAWLPHGPWQGLGAVWLVGAGVGLSVWLANLRQEAFLGPANGETGDDRSEAQQLRRTALGLALLPVVLIGLCFAQQALEPHLNLQFLPQGPQWLWAAMFYSLGVLGSATFAYAVLLPRMQTRWDLRHRSRLGAVGALGLYGAVLSLLIACLAPLIWVTHELGSIALSSRIALGALVATRVFARPSQAQLESALSKLMAAGRKLALPILVPLGFVASVVSIAAGLIDLTEYVGHPERVLLLAFMLSFAAIGVLGLAIDFNRISPHYFYRDRLAEGFLRTVERTAHGLELARDDEQLPLAHLHGRLRPSECDALLAQRTSARPGRGPAPPAERRSRAALETAAAHIEELDRQSVHEQQGALARAGQESFDWASTYFGIVRNSAPYHLIVCALNLAGSHDLARKNRKSDHFIFSRLFCGSTTTGYQLTDVYDGGRSELARAMTISGAAAASAAGVYTSTLHAFAATLFNIRLGYWMQNPRSFTPGAGLLERISRFADARGITFWPYYLLLELFGQTSASQRMVNLSDGGHTGDNTALCPLLERRCDLIVVCDAGCDPRATCDDLAAAVRIAYVDENVVVNIDTHALAPVGDALPEASYALGTIHYPRVEARAATDPDALAKIGHVLYLKSVLPGGELPVSVRSYVATHPDFPHESTGDQFFDDAQFEAYRGLGEALATRMIRALRKSTSVGSGPHSLTRLLASLPGWTSTPRLDDAA